MKWVEALILSEPWVAILLCVAAWIMSIAATWLAWIEHHRDSCCDQFRFHLYVAMAITGGWHGVFSYLSVERPTVLRAEQVPFMFWLSAFAGTLVFLTQRIRHHLAHDDHRKSRRVRSICPHARAHT